MKSISLNIFLALFLASSVTADVKQIIDSPIVLATYHGEDPTKRENQVIVVGRLVFKTVDGLTQWLSERRDHPEYPTRYVIYGDCCFDGVRFSQEEIEKIKKACAKAGVRFYYYPAG